MKTRHALPGLLAIVATIGLAQPADRFAAVEIQDIPVKAGIHMLVGAGGNIGVSAGADGLLIIDDQFAPLSDKIRRALEKIGPGQPKFVLNTHHHGDHTGGNAAFGAESLIVAHDNVRVRLLAGGGPAAALPVVTYDDSITIHFNGEAISVRHLPNGHTDGDSIVFFESSNVIHMGDHHFAGRFPFVDLSSGGTLAGFIENVATVIRMIDDETMVIPGHGELSTRADLSAFHDMLTETTAAVREAVAEGKDLEAIKRQGLGAKWASYGQGFVNEERWIETIYRSIAP